MRPAAIPAPPAPAAPAIHPFVGGVWKPSRRAHQCGSDELQLAHEGHKRRLLPRRQLHAENEVEELDRILQRQEAPVVQIWRRVLDPPKGEGLDGALSVDPLIVDRARLVEAFDPQIVHLVVEVRRGGMTRRTVEAGPFQKVLFLVVVRDERDPLCRIREQFLIRHASSVLTRRDKRTTLTIRVGFGGPSSAPMRWWSGVRSPRLGLDDLVALERQHVPDELAVLSLSSTTRISSFATAYRHRERE